MKYYRVKHDVYDYFHKYGVVEGELLTKKERFELVPYLPDSDFEEVNISKSLTFTCFGVRKKISDSMYDAVFKKCGVE